MNDSTLAIIGCGNLGRAIATGLVDAGAFEPKQVTLTRRKTERLDDLAAEGFVVTANNATAVRTADLVILAVEPHQADDLVRDLADSIHERKPIVISVVTGLTRAHISELLGNGQPVVRAMPNTAVAVRESMTCLSIDPDHPDATAAVESLFANLGRTAIIDEDQMISATALAACGTAFFLRAIRAASQGGIEIGFSAAEALAIAAQTARGAATLLIERENHPEDEIDRVTTPMGCTIAGLNLMEYEGFSAAMIKGITVSAAKARGLHDPD